MTQTATWIGELPSDVRTLLQRRATHLKKEPQQVVVEILRKDLIIEREALSEGEKVLEVLEASGLIRPLGDKLQAMVDVTITQGEVERSLSQAGGKPLSEIIIEQRRESHERFLL